MASTATRAFTATGYQANGKHGAPFVSVNPAFSTTSSEFRPTDVHGYISVGLGMSPLQARLLAADLLVAADEADARKSDAKTEQAP
jgi:hypothetical protein